jgi:hypothetical protein
MNNKILLALFFAMIICMPFSLLRGIYAFISEKIVSLYSKDLQSGEYVGI